MMPDTVHSPQNESMRSTVEDFEGFDPQKFQGSIGDRRLMQDLGVIFREDVLGLLAGAYDALQKGKAEVLAEVGHGLKGMLGNYAAARAYNLAKDLEFAARRGEMGVAKDLLQRLTGEVASVGQALERYLKSV